MKKNQTLYSHVLDMIGVLDGVKNILLLNELELKVLMVAITIHDLNKLEEHSEKSYSRIISEQNSKGEYANILKECQEFNIQDFLPEYKEYIEDIRAIIGQHSAHTSYFAENLICSPERYKLGDEKIEILISIIRALDVIDLSKTMDEQEKKRQFLNHINNATKYKGKQYKLVAHTISEDRGILTNTCNNAVVEFLQGKAFVDVAYYKEGVLYLVEDKEIIFDEEDREKLVSNCVKSIKSKIFNDFKVYINNVQSGIKVDEKCLGITPIENIIYEIKIRCEKSKIPDISKKNEIIKVIVAKYAELYSNEKLQELEGNISKLEMDIEGTTDKKVLSKIKKELKEKTCLLREQKTGKGIFQRKVKEEYFIENNEDKLRFSEFIRSFYNFLKDHICTSPLLSWVEVYEFFSISEEDKDYLDAFEGLYIRPYVLGQLIYDDYKGMDDELTNRIIKYLEDKISSKESKDEDAMWVDLKDYFNRNIILSFDNKITFKKENALREYSEKKSSKCCLCSSEYETSNWMAADVPYKLKIQNFSNKINGGAREPKRNICSICNIEYLLHKVTYASKVEVSRRYLSILPRGFNTKSYIRAFRESINQFKSKDISAIYFNEYSTFVSLASKNVEEIEPLFTQAKINGIALPNYSETLTNYFILPIHLVKKDNETSKWISTLLYALTFNISFDSKIVISEFPVPILDQSEMEEIYVGEVPVAFRNIFEKNWTKEECLNTIKLFVNLFSLAKTLGETADIVYDSLKALAKGKTNFIYCIYKKIKNKKDNPTIKIKEIKDCVDGILSYVEDGETLVSNIKELAIFANQNYIRGSINGGFIKDNSINKPLNIIMDLLCRWDKKIYTKEDITVLCKSEIQKYFRRVDPYYGKKRIEAIEKYVDLFMNKILDETLGGKVYNLENEKKNILSTYSYYYRLAMSKSNKSGSED
ncbi:type I-D CRISPR-associated protein Cas10d/Csc3 [Clostridium estertheticum]|uniref:type I-D CRISPR-associated protein Cas10d/Csc3 n=1 Tax=Clostridium estertheticum TaxID=238834 RepID=UPI001C6EB480|nr:type I-D CRISPR-associated protein Cas10d/Csc3 [Clostridium estertheticum]MBW9152360.1 type I-D CRISPR-associated protein Cas10d/Csc3 [Clostridium estertheticum]WLC82785.1 type I-D CRISPR-associated protein Cas10d/Csc3 [Clostridium estertheticum]